MRGTGTHPIDAEIDGSFVAVVRLQGSLHAFEDRCTHDGEPLAGAEIEAAADIIVQEYGRYFNLPTCALRGGCLTGPNHSGVQLHGFLSYLVKCNLEEIEYTVFGYKGKQVRDNIHCDDVVSAFEAFHRAPRAAAVPTYDINGTYVDEERHRSEKV